MVTCSKLPSEDGSVISDESGKLNCSRGLSVQKVLPLQKMTKEEAHKRTGRGRQGLLNKHESDSALMWWSVLLGGHSVRGAGRLYAVPPPWSLHLQPGGWARLSHATLLHTTLWFYWFQHT
ncbi:hypothetical protein SKAU_G00244450 [Synaphobranchus kaupii]|uniref:Uncharacterized protein n=1 Tax=Synaphobranchus kaupii TaxID=118154 RepID=A0A9Q1F1W8_SYNKA|nr:hypothetical protein SKAU_G00244450 [Synaphobranchus kaupii]